MVYYLRKQLAVRKQTKTMRLLAAGIGLVCFHRAKAHEREDAKRIRACTAKKRQRCEKTQSVFERALRKNGKGARRREADSSVHCEIAEMMRGERNADL